MIWHVTQTTTHLILCAVTEDVIIKLQNALLTLSQWFFEKKMRANACNYHFICSTGDMVNLNAENQKKYVTGYVKNFLMLGLIH